LDALFPPSGWMSAASTSKAGYLRCSSEPTRSLNSLASQNTSLIR
jgi:hypothetical protein